jgi:hypothetical protein
VTYAYNTQVNSSTGYRPFDLALTRGPRPLEVATPVDVSLFCGTGPLPTFNSAPQPFVLAHSPDIMGDGVDPTEVAFRAFGRARRNRDVMRHIVTAGARYKQQKHLNAAIIDPEALIGKVVFVRAETRDDKLAPKGKGPYHVISCHQRAVIVRGDKGPFQVTLGRISDALDESGVSDVFADRPLTHERGEQPSGGTAIRKNLHR